MKVAAQSGKQGVCQLSVCHKSVLFENQEYGPHTIFTPRRELRERADSHSGTREILTGG